MSLIGVILVRMRENADQYNSEYTQFPRIENYQQKLRNVSEGVTSAEWLNIYIYFSFFNSSFKHLTRIWSVFCSFKILMVLWCLCYFPKVDRDFMHSFNISIYGEVLHRISLVTKVWKPSNFDNVLTKFL